MVRVVWITNKGKKRDINEDALLVDNIIVQDDDMQKPQSKDISKGVILSVADGLGGHSSGEIASKLTLKTLLEYKPVDKQEIVKTLRQAHYRLMNYCAVNPQCFGFGCCIAGIIIAESNEITIFNVGDCRVYKFQNNVLYKLTKDHSYVQELIDKGMVTVEQSINFPYRNVVTESIGGIMDYRFIDVRTYMDIIRENDIYLICSDGLFEELAEKEIEQTLTSDLEKSAEELFRKVMEKGAKDNVSIILCQLNMKL